LDITTQQLDGILKYSGAGVEEIYVKNVVKKICIPPAEVTDPNDEDERVAFYDEDEDKDEDCDDDVANPKGAGMVHVEKDELKA
jgi:hypothetical protein